MPLLAVGALALVVDRQPWLTPFDTQALAAELAQGRVDEALTRLAQARSPGLPEALAGVNWWPPEARARRLQDLAGEVAELPAAAAPQLVSPVGRQRGAPRLVRLSGMVEHPVTLEIHSRELGLLAGELTFAVGQDNSPIDIKLLPGTTYDLHLVDAEGASLSLASFEILPDDEARDLGRLMATAHGLASGGPGGELLAAIVALHFGLREEALDASLELFGDPPLGAVARELAAIALARLDRPAEALALLEQEAR